MTRLSILAVLAASTALCTPTFADNPKPRGWNGASEAYNCVPEEWFLNSLGQWNNPTCETSGPDVVPVAEEPTPPPGDDDDGGEDPCACLPEESASVG